jgi:hypothetical protein
MRSDAYLLIARGAQMSVVLLAVQNRKTLLADNTLHTCCYHHFLDK